MKSLFLSKKVASISLAVNLLFSPLVSAENMSPTEQKKLTEITHLLQENPEMIEGLHANLTQYLEGQSTISDTLKQNHDYLYNNPMQPYIGSEAPKLTIINFTDYNCPYCKRLESGLTAMVKKFPDVRVVNIYLPFQQRMVPGLETNTAWYALNVWENNKPNFAEVHRLMMAKPSRHDSKSILKIAKMTNTTNELQVNDAKKQLVEKNEEIFKALGLRGTPSLIIGSEIIPGFIPEEQLEETIAAQLKMLEAQ